MFTLRNFFIDYISLSFYNSNTFSQNSLRIAFYKSIDSVESVLSVNCPIEYRRVFFYSTGEVLTKELQPSSSTEGGGLPAGVAPMEGTIYVSNYSREPTETGRAVGPPIIRCSQESYKVFLTMFRDIFQDAGLWQYMRLTRLDLKYNGFQCRVLHPPLPSIISNSTSLVNLYHYFSRLNAHRGFQQSIRLLESSGNSTLYLNDRAKDPVCLRIVSKKTAKWENIYFEAEFKPRKNFTSDACARIALSTGDEAEIINIFACQLLPILDDFPLLLSNYTNLYSVMSRVFYFPFSIRHLHLCSSKVSLSQSSFFEFEADHRLFLVKANCFFLPLHYLDPSKLKPCEDCLFRLKLVFLLNETLKHAMLWFSFGGPCYGDFEQLRFYPDFPENQRRSDYNENLLVQSCRAFMKKRRLRFLIPFYYFLNTGVYGDNKMASAGVARRLLQSPKEFPEILKVSILNANQNLEQFVIDLTQTDSSPLFNFATPYQPVFNCRCVYLEIDVARFFHLSCEILNFAEFPMLESVLHNPPWHDSSFNPTFQTCKYDGFLYILFLNLFVSRSFELSLASIWKKVAPRSSFLVFLRNFLQRFPSKSLKKSSQVLLFDIVRQRAPAKKKKAFSQKELKAVVSILNKRPSSGLARFPRGLLEMSDSICIKRESLKHLL